MITPGFHRHTEAEYFGDTTHLSASGAKILLGHRPPRDSWALQFGSLVHMMLLEPERYDRECVTLDADTIGVKADGSKADNPTMTGAWKRAVAQASADGLKVVAQADADRARAMVEAVRKHPTAGALIAAASDFELSAYGVNEATGAPIRGRLDLLGPGFIADLKTIGNADPAEFGRTAAAFGYHVSAANYWELAAQNGHHVEAFAFILAEKEPTPGGEHRVSVCQLTGEALAEGSRLMAEACRRWLDNDKRVDLPALGDGFHTVDLPPWAYRSSTPEYDEIQGDAA